MLHPPMHGLPRVPVSVGAPTRPLVTPRDFNLTLTLTLTLTLNPNPNPNPNPNQARAQHGLELVAREAMPANNFLLIFRKAA